MISYPILAATSSLVMLHGVDDILPNKTIHNSSTVRGLSRFAESWSDNRMNDNCESFSNNGRALS